jgi:hypothetical protein
MAERLAPLPATQGARVQSPVPAGPAISVEKVALFCNPVLGTRSLALQWGRFINKKRGEKNKNRGERQKNSENQVTLDSIFGASKKHYLSNFVLYML